MSSPRERLLAEGIKRRLIAIQKSRQIYKKLAKWEKKALVMNEKQIENVSNLIATKIENYVSRIEVKTGNQPNLDQIKAKIKEELDRI